MLKSAPRTQLSQHWHKMATACGIQKWQWIESLDETSFEIWANGTVKLLKSYWLTYKVNRTLQYSYSFGQLLTEFFADVLQVVCLDFLPRFCLVFFVEWQDVKYPLLWLLLRHLSLAQRYLGRANREVAFRSPCSLQGCLHYGEQGIIKIRNVCSSWLSRRPTSIKKALKPSLFIPPIWTEFELKYNRLCHKPVGIFIPSLRHVRFVSFSWHRPG